MPSPAWATTEASTPCGRPGGGARATCAGGTSPTEASSARSSRCAARPKRSARPMRPSVVPSSSASSIPTGRRPPPAADTLTTMSTRGLTDRGDRTPHPPPRGRLSALPAPLDRRFEAVIVWSSTPVISARTAQSLVDLCEAGVLVGWLAPAPVDELVDRMTTPSADAAAFLLADSDGTGATAVDRSGANQLWVPQRDLDLDAVDRAGRALVEALAGTGLVVTTLPRPVGCPRVDVELVPDPEVRATRSGLKQLLLAHGIRGVPHLAELATEAARSAGLDDPRVVVRDTRVEIAVVDAGDVALGMVEELWRRGVDPQAVLIVVDGLSGVPHRPAPVIDPDVRAATVVVVNGPRVSPGRGTVTLTGGAARLRQLLADQ